MDKNVKVTVGIPVFNAEKYLAFSIQSIINQTWKDWELIIIDDGSTDNSLRIAGSFDDPRIRVIHDEKNRGISYRLNQIIQEAKGEFLTRMDADDIAFPERLEKQISMFRNNHNLDVVDSHAVIINEKHEIIGYRAVIPDHSLLIQTFGSPRFIHPTVMFRKIFIEKHLYRGEFNGAEDIDLWIRSFKNIQPGKISEPLLFYRESDNINLKTYAFRCNQQQKLFMEHKKKIGTLSFFKLLIKVRMKQFIYTLASILNLDSILIKRRNKPLAPAETSFYNAILQSAIRR